ncbi:alpha-N-acetylgalactosaminide alpha-2,6-sialyltransferase 2 isoform X1 [Pelobates cultripes]|uniref:Alpha-N-acetylgalactosaminide alpha-2,6-sialyltransferase 2 isoform X1 n=1 Tax=Pelobates cultripes TaxID=61616 RepID=A0AAD1SNE6_PELCU|nr:alpha-N-acetylgalactosaminide alpha-2,6-sialyltransferase 2 isoform X1 [Pelobates cultripes]
MRPRWLKLVGVLAVLVLSAVFYGQYYTSLVPGSSIHRTREGPDSSSNDRQMHFFESHKEQERNRDLKQKDRVPPPAKEDTPLACPTSLQLLARNDSVFSKLFKFDIPLLLWDSHMTENNWDVLSQRPVPYGWKDLPRKGVGAHSALWARSSKSSAGGFPDGG